MICSNCKANVSEDTTFCPNCGTKILQEKNTFCTTCGNKIPPGTAFCTNCGSGTNVSNNTPDIPQTLNSKKESTLIGFSDVYNHPEIIAAAKKDRKSSIGCVWIFFFVPLIGFPIAGLTIESFPFGESVIIGIGLSLIILLLGLIALKGSKKPMWEGSVTKKYKKNKVKTENNENISYTLYTVEIRTDSGKKKTIVERDGDRDMYNYLAVGDRIRYHPKFRTYEKYDKSKDSNIYCNICSTVNPIKNDRCKKCNNLLFK